MQGYDLNLIDKRADYPNWQYGDAQLEFYPADELYNPMPGKPTIEIFNPNLEGQWLENAIFGDMLHGMPARDPRFAEYREQFRSSMTPKQWMRDRWEFNRQRQRNPNERRTFDDWHDQSGLDAWLRGYLAPDERNEWAQMYTDPQRNILGELLNYLQQPQSGYHRMPDGTMMKDSEHR
jgi:hypothetical protein